MKLLRLLYDHVNRISFIYLLFGGLHAFGIFVLPNVIDDDASVSFLQRNWGFHFLAYFPLPVAGLAYAIFAASLIHRVQDRVVATLIKIHTRTSRFRKHTVYCLISTAALIVFWLLQQKYMILGDGHVRSAELDLGIVHASAANYVHVLMGVTSTFGLTGRETIKVASIVQGFPFVFLALLVSHEIGTTVLTRVISALIIICSGVVQFYVGYVEIYAPIPILTLLAVWFGLKGVNRAAFRYYAFAISAAAALTHPVGAMLVPPSLYLIWFHDIRGKGALVTGLCGALLAAGILCGVLLGLADEVLSAALPVLPDQQNVYAMLTVVNVWERLNGLILGCSACPPAIVRRRAPSPTSNGLKPGKILADAGAPWTHRPLGM